MKKMTRYFGFASAALALVLFAHTAAAQGGGRRGDPQKMIDRQVAAMKDKLQLTDSQAASVRQILSDSAAQMKALREKYPRPERGQGPSQDMRNEMRQIREQTHAKLAQILDPQQMQTFEQWRNQAGPGFGRHGRKGQ